MHIARESEMATMYKHKIERDSRCGHIIKNIDVSSQTNSLRDGATTGMFAGLLQLLDTSVGQVLDLVDAHQPMLRGIGLLQDVQLKVLVADLSRSHPIVALGLAALRVHLTEAIVAHLVHQAIEERGRALLVHTELPVGRIVVLLADMCPTIGAAANANHPQELVDVVRGVAGEAAKDDQDIVHIQFAHDLVRLLLRRGHGLAHTRNVRIVPGIIVHQNGAIGHGCYLVAIIPPRHDAGVLENRKKTA